MAQVTCVLLCSIHWLLHAKKVLDTQELNAELPASSVTAEWSLTGASIPDMILIQLMPSQLGASIEKQILSCCAWQITMPLASVHMPCAQMHDDLAGLPSSAHDCANLVLETTWYLHSQATKVSSTQDA